MSLFKGTHQDACGTRNPTRTKSCLLSSRCWLITVIAGSLLFLTGCFELDISWDVRDDGSVESSVILEVEKNWVDDTDGASDNDVGCESWLSDIVEAKGHSIPFLVEQLNINNSTRHSNTPIEWEETDSTCSVGVNVEFLSTGSTASQFLELDDGTWKKFQFPHQLQQLLGDYILQEDGSKALKLRDSKIGFNINLPGKILHDLEGYKPATRFFLFGGGYKEDPPKLLFETTSYEVSDNNTSTQIMWEYEDYNNIANFLSLDTSSYKIENKSYFETSPLIYILTLILFVMLLLLVFIHILLLMF